MKLEKRDTGSDYIVIDISALDGEIKLKDLDFEECLTTRCTNKSALSKVTGIKYDRLVYLFSKRKQRKRFLVENGNLILRVNSVYKGSQTGGFRPKGSKMKNYDY